MHFQICVFNSATSQYYLPKYDQKDELNEEIGKFHTTLNTIRFSDADIKYEVYNYPKNLQCCLLATLISSLATCGYGFFFQSPTACCIGLTAEAGRHLAIGHFNKKYKIIENEAVKKITSLVNSRSLSNLQITESSRIHNKTFIIKVNVPIQSSSNFKSD